MSLTASLEAMGRQQPDDDEDDQQGAPHAHPEPQVSNDPDRGTPWSPPAKAGRLKRAGQAAVRGVERLNESPMGRAPLTPRLEEGAAAVAAAQRPDPEMVALHADREQKKAERRAEDDRDSSGLAGLRGLVPGRRAQEQQPQEPAQQPEHGTGPTATSVIPVVGGLGANRTPAQPQFRLRRSMPEPRSREQVLSGIQMPAPKREVGNAGPKTPEERALHRSRLAASQGVPLELGEEDVRPEAEKAAKPGMAPGSKGPEWFEQMRARLGEEQDRLHGERLDADRGDIAERAIGAHMHPEGSPEFEAGRREVRGMLELHAERYGQPEAASALEHAKGALAKLGAGRRNLAFEGRPNGEGRAALEAEKAASRAAADGPATGAHPAPVDSAQIPAVGGGTGGGFQAAPADAEQKRAANRVEGAANEHNQLVARLRSGAVAEADEAAHRAEIARTAGVHAGAVAAHAQADPEGHAELMRRKTHKLAAVPKPSTVAAARNRQPGA